MEDLPQKRIEESLERHKKIHEITDNFYSALEGGIKGELITRFCEKYPEHFLTKSLTEKLEVQKNYYLDHPGFTGPFYDDSFFYLAETNKDDLLSKGVLFFAAKFLERMKGSSGDIGLTVDRGKVIPKREFLSREIERTETFLKDFVGYFDDIKAILPPDEFAMLMEGEKRLLRQKLPQRPQLIKRLKFI